MAGRKDSTGFKGLLFRFLGAEDPMLSMLEQLCRQMMESEVSNKTGADKHEQRSLRKRVIWFRALSYLAALGSARAQFFPGPGGCIPNQG
jgi:hypothetical protein